MSTGERRSKLKLYYDILSAISHESQNGEVRPTRVQHLCNMSYDKMTKYLKELKSRKMITKPSLSVTEKGKFFLQDYNKIKDFVEVMELEYFSAEEKIEN